VRPAGWIVAAALVVASCSGGGPSTGSSVATTPPPSSPDSSASTAEWPRVDLIDDALTALEAKLGGPQQYFEVNATSKLVNVFVALNDGKVVQPWVYLDGELTSTEGHDATGFTFARSAIDFDPGKVLTKVQSQLPESKPDAFFVEGGEGGIVRYSVAVTSPQGGQLVVVVAADGEVLSVET